MGTTFRAFAWSLAAFLVAAAVLVSLAPDDAPAEATGPSGAGGNATSANDTSVNGMAGDATADDDAGGNETAADAIPPPVAGDGANASDV